jgi:hypothetical protein
MTRALADARPARTRLLFGYFFLATQEKVTPTAGATAPAGANKRKFIQGRQQEHSNTCQEPCKNTRP